MHLLCADVGSGVLVFFSLDFGLIFFRDFEMTCACVILWWAEDRVCGFFVCVSICTTVICMCICK